MAEQPADKSNAWAALGCFLCFLGTLAGALVGYLMAKSNPGHAGGHGGVGGLNFITYPIIGGMIGLAGGVAVSLGVLIWQTVSKDAGHEADSAAPGVQQTPAPNSDQRLH